MTDSIAPSQKTSSPRRVSLLASMVMNGTVCKRVCVQHSWLKRQVGCDMPGDEEVWLQRVAKRKNSIETLKRDAVYMSYLRDPHAPRPLTPPPEDRVSTRQFRHRVKEWRKALRSNVDAAQFS